MPREQGFSLLEILVALVILSLAFTAIFTAISNNAKTLLYLENKTIANWVALNILAKNKLNWAEKSSNNSSGSVIMLGKTWYWSSHISNTFVRQIDIDIRTAPNTNTFYHLRGFLGNPS